MQVNVGMKINVKLGGKNHIISNQLPIVARAPTMVMGADVHHASPGSMKPSIAAVCHCSFWCPAQFLSWVYSD
jgi:eukaryotic translation initiation factor 2C